MVYLFQQIGFFKKWMEKSGPIPVPFPNQDGYHGLMPTGKGVLNGKKWMSGQKASAHPFCAGSSKNVRTCVRTSGNKHVAFLKTKNVPVTLTPLRPAAGVLREGDGHILTYFLDQAGGQDQVVGHSQQDRSGPECADDDGDDPPAGDR